MLVLNPRSVRFGNETWSGVVFVAIDRWAGELNEEFGEGGPYCVFVDTPVRKVQVKVVQEVSDSADNGPALGEQDELSFVRAPNAADTERRRVVVSAVVTRVGYDITRGGSARRVVEMRAVGTDGGVDPVSDEAA